MWGCIAGMGWVVGGTISQCAGYLHTAMCVSCARRALIPSRCQLEQLMDAIAQVMQAVLRALPEKALDVAHGALRRAWHVAGATPSLELLQTIVLRTLSGQQPFSFQVSSPPSTYS